jgi:cephalosporin hydroxylase
MSTIFAHDISILVCAYNMQRELPRTLLTLSRRYQTGIDSINYEVVVLDNGSTPAVDENALRSVLPDVRVVRPALCTQSPAKAINEAMRQMQGRLLGLWIDGARLASPGVIAKAFEAWKADDTKAIGTLAFHLGPDVQMRSVFDGYNTAAEDALLESVRWKEDGYRLFEISCLAGSSAAGWFGCIHETNALFLDRRIWNELGGLDERFAAPGGGFVNLDLWERAVNVSDRRPWLILGEGTFHQVHGGAATNGNDAARTAMREEYEVIHGRPFRPLNYQARFVGILDDVRYRAGSPRQLDRHRLVHTVGGRHFRVGLSADQLERIQAGTLRTAYRDLRLAKNPFDLALYLRVIQQHRPAAIIEIGTSEGGSAAWFRDQCRSVGLAETRVISIDRSPPSINLDGIKFLFGDANDPDSTFPHAELESAPHPWLIIEDSAHTHQSTSAMLAYFDKLMRIGDRIVIEDGVVADLPGDQYRGFQDGPNRAVAEFLLNTGSRYAIDIESCDFYGQNLTYAPNGWLVKRE